MKEKRIVIKIGSSILASKRTGIDERFLDRVVSQVAKLSDSGINVCLVSSGAILAGLSILKQEKIPSKVSKLQAIASVGQAVLMNVYNNLFKKYKKISAQVLLTWDDFQDRKRYINAKNTLFTLLKEGVIPVVNENDTVSTEEIKFGDNDRLSALVAGLVDAEVLLILSDIEGFYFKGRLLKRAEGVSPDFFKEAKGKKFSFTKGGMFSKLEAAQLANTFGIKTIIANGKRQNLLIEAILERKELGTTFLPSSRVSARKRWIAYSRKPKGEIIIDKGAEKALIEKNSSLLSQGIKEVKGNFLKKDTVQILNEEGKILGWGLVNYDSQELALNKGKKLPLEVIHRDNLVINSVCSFKFEEGLC